jgi:hypothetical protein
MFLLDTHVISELRRPDKADRSVAAWANALPAAIVRPVARPRSRSGTRVAEAAAQKFQRQLSPVPH